MLCPPPRPARLLRPLGSFCSPALVCARGGFNLLILFVCPSAECHRDTSSHAVVIMGPYCLACDGLVSTQPGRPQRRGFCPPFSDDGLVLCASAPAPAPASAPAPAPAPSSQALHYRSRPSVRTAHWRATEPCRGFVNHDKRALPCDEAFTAASYARDMRHATCDMRYAIPPINHSTARPAPHRPVPASAGAFAWLPARQALPGRRATGCQCARPPDPRTASSLHARAVTHPRVERFVSCPSPRLHRVCHLHAHAHAHAHLHPHLAHDHTNRRTRPAPRPGQQGCVLSRCIT